MSRMNLQRQPFNTPFMSHLARDVDQLQDSIQRMFENPFTAMRAPMALPESLGWYPPVDVTETDTEVTMTAELPGLDLADVKLELDGDVLTLRGEKRSERVEEGRKKEYHLEERTYGAFQRSFTVPPVVDGAKISATFDKGVLTLHMPKDGIQKPRGREIPIKAT